MDIWRTPSTMLMGIPWRGSFRCKLCLRLHLCLHLCLRLCLRLSLSLSLSLCRWLYGELSMGKRPSRELKRHLYSILWKLLKDSGCYIKGRHDKPTFWTTDAEFVQGSKLLYGKHDVTLEAFLHYTIEGHGALNLERLADELSSEETA